MSTPFEVDGVQSKQDQVAVPPRTLVEKVGDEEREEISRMPNIEEVAIAYQIGLDILEADVEDMSDLEFDKLAQDETALHKKIGGHGVGLVIHKKEAEYFKAQAAVLTSMADGLKHKARMIENQADRKRWRLKEIMDRFGIKKIKGPHATVSITNVAPSLDVLNEAMALKALPAEFVITERRIDKGPLLKALKEPDVDGSGWGVSLKTGVTTISVRG